MVQKFYLLMLLTIAFCGVAQSNEVEEHKQNSLITDENKNEDQQTKYSGKIVEYDLYIGDKMVNFTGKMRHAIAVNGQIPAPTLHFKEGDTAIIRVHNLMKMETSIHWHGILLPNKEDGVSNLTTPPIEPGKTHTFTFPIIQSGTYWYHSHTMLQEQVGLYGAIVIQPAKKEHDLKEYVLVLSDWTDENPHEVQRYLKRTGEWYAVKKGSLQSYGEAIAAGYFIDKLKLEWQRMPMMDVTDVYYDKFLVNGRENTYFKDAKPGEVVRLRIINGSAASYFTLQYAGGMMQVISADGINVKPFPTEKLEIATAETYDVLITIPDAMSYELRATVSDVTGYSSAFFGDGMIMKAPDVPRLNYFQLMREMNNMSAMNTNGMDMSADQPMNMQNMQGMDMSKHNGHSKKDQPMNNMQKMGENGNKKDRGNMGMDGGGTDMGNMQGMNMSPEFSYDKLRALHPTTLDPAKPWREIRLKLTGNMLRYIWSFDNKTLAEADKILIRKGENVRMIFENTTMMRHPLHLHGHFFRVVNAQGEYSPMKHTFDIKPMSTVTIEFEANEQQDWFFHCHILYHMMAGMARIVSYEGSEQNEFAKTGYRKLKREHQQIYPWYDLTVHSQGLWLDGNLSGDKIAFEAEGRTDYKGDFETETHLLRYLDNAQYFAPFVGYDYRNSKDLGSEEGSENTRKVFDVGFYYLLPMLVRSEWRVDQNGDFRLQLEREGLALSNNVFFDWRVNTDKEYTLSFRYMISKYVSISANYDSDYKWGAGFTWHY